MMNKKNDNSFFYFLVDDSLSGRYDELKNVVTLSPNDVFFYYHRITNDLGFQAIAKRFSIRKSG